MEASQVDQKNNDSENFSSQTFRVGGGMLEVIISNVEKLRKDVEKLRKDVEKLRKNVEKLRKNVEKLRKSDEKLRKNVEKLRKNDEKLRKNDRKNKSKKFIMIKQIKFGFTLHDASNLELERATAELKLSESGPSPSYLLIEPI